jgi:hypothetical protein
VARTKSNAYPEAILDLMAEKTAVLSKAHALSEMGMLETAQALWVSAASYEERLAPQLEALGRDREAAVHRISAASCYHKAGDPSRAANLYRAALAGPLRAANRRDVQRMLAECLAELASPAKAPKSKRKVTAEA